MQDFLYDYQEMNPTTWVYFSSLIAVSVYFKFHRFWSVRNLDLIGLIFLAPGLLLIAHGRDLKRSPLKPVTDAVVAPHTVGDAGAGSLAPQPPAGDLPARPAEPKEKPESPAAHGRQMEQLGYLWLFVIGALFLLRMLVDSAMVRRPLLEPNLSLSGLMFACVAMLFFLMPKVFADPPAKPGALAVKTGDKAAADDAKTDVQKILKQRGPGYPWFHVVSAGSGDIVQQTAALLGHLAVVLGMVLIGYRHFDNAHTGIAAATLYLLLPYTAQYTPRVDHVVPAALLVWAIQSYRRPVLSGIFVGLAAGLIWYPLFLLPLWCSFYWRRGLLRFSISVAVVLGLVAASLLLTPPDLGSFGTQFQQTFAVLWHVRSVDIRGFWEPPLSPYRWPVMAAFFAMCGSLVLWPAQKNLGSLLACSAAIMLGTQFFKAYEGGTYMAWYLPLLILTILRPNLEDRVALSAISEGWWKWRK